MIVSLIVAPARDVRRLHLGVARVGGRADRRPWGQLLGSQIPYASADSLAVGALVITIVGTPLVALAMPALRHGDDDLARRLATRTRAVLLAVIALAADREQRLAQRAAEESVIVEHALVERRLLAFLLVPREGAPRRRALARHQKAGR
jgi:hypothetical protein